MSFWGGAVAEFDERTIGGWTVRIDRLICVGFGDCIQGADPWFELDDEGIAVFRPEEEGRDPASLLEACRACPVDAMTVIDAGGRQLAP